MNNPFRRIISWKLSVCLALAVLPFLLEAALAEEAAWPHDNSGIPPDPGVTWGVLDNGLRYALLPHPEPPGRVSLRLLVEAGSLMETDRERGLAHYLEHMAFNGTRNFPADEMVKYFQRLGMAFGPDNNAYTGLKETVYQLELPDTAPALLEDGFKLLGDYACGMLLEPEEVEKERGVILAEKRARDSVKYRTMEAELEATLPESIVHERLPIGKEDVIRNTTREDLLAFYRKWYTPDRMTVIAAGAVETEVFIPLIKKYFGPLRPPAKPVPDPDIGKVSARVLAADYHYEEEAPATTVSLQAIHPHTGLPDTRERRAADLLLEAATGIMNRRLDILGKREGAVFTKGECYARDWVNFVRQVGVDLTCEPENWRKTLAAAEQELRRAAEHGFRQGETDEIRARLLKRRERAARTAPTRESLQLANQLARAVSRGQVFTHPDFDYELARDVLGKMTPEACREAFEKAWHSRDALIFVSGNAEIEDAEFVIRDVFRSSGITKVGKWRDLKERPFSCTRFGEAGEVISRHWHEDLGVAQFKWDNQVWLNYKKTSFETNTVHVAARFGAGLLAVPEDKPGLRLLADQFFIPGGLAEHSADELERLFAGKTVDVSFSVAEDAFVLSGKTAPEDMKSQLQLMCAYLTAPGYREDGLRQVRKNFTETYGELRRTIRGVLKNEVERTLHGGDFRFGYPPLETLLKRTPEELREWLEPALSGSLLEVSVVGDITEDAVLDAVRTTFGALPDRASAKPLYIKERRVRFPRGLPMKTFSCESAIPKALAAVYWPAGDVWDISRARRLNLLAKVLDERLREKIREDSGEAYSPYAFSHASDTFKDYGYLAAHIVADPGNAEKLAAKTRAIGEVLTLKGITPDELERALKPMLEQLDKWVRDNRYWLGTVLISSREYPQRLQWARNMREDFAAITAEDLNRLAKEYLTPEKALTLIIQPVKTSAEPPPPASPSGQMLRLPPRRPAVRAGL